MIKYFYFAITLVVLCSLHTVAQPQVTVGKPYPVYDNDFSYYFSEKGQVMTFKRKGRKMAIQKLNAATMTQERITMYEDLPKNAGVHDILKLKGHYYLIYSLYEDRAEKLFYREIDFDKGTFKGQDKLLMSVDQKITTAVPGLLISTFSEFDFTFSKDSSVILVKYRVEQENRERDLGYDNDVTIGMHVFDNNFKQQWTSIVKMPYTKKMMSYQNYFVDSRGNAYVTTRVFNYAVKELKKKGDDEGNHRLEILKITPGASAPVVLEVKANEKWINALWMYEGKNGNMVWAGYYNRDKNDGSIDGISVFKMNAEGNLYQQRHYEIPQAMRDQYVSSRMERNNVYRPKMSTESGVFADMVSMFIHRVMISDDGSMLIVGEERFSVDYYSRGFIKSTDHANNMLVARIASDGSFSWIREIPKRQQSTSGFREMGYVQFSNGQNQYFVFLDNSKNRDLQSGAEPVLYEDGFGGTYTLYELNDQTGAMRRISLFDTESVGGMKIYNVSPARTVQTGPGTLLLQAYKKNNEDVLVKVKLD